MTDRITSDVARKWAKHLVRDNEVSAGEVVLQLADQMSADEQRMKELEKDIEDLEQEKLDAVWSEQEHQRAVAAIQQAESLDKNHYPSFQERVWWRAFEARVVELEGVVERAAGLPDVLLAIMRKNGYKFERFPRNLEKNPPVTDGERWEALAFSICTHVVELSSQAEESLLARSAAPEVK